MERGLDFIGIGAQRAGTSWIYSALYEHPQVCIPVKEIHFFSRDRNWRKGYQWYESIFSRCPSSQKKGEFSTSYLSDAKTPERIYKKYPDVKLIVSLRNPVERAFSNYKNDIMAGVVRPHVSFSEALKNHPEYIENGLYAKHLKRYLQYFDRKQILILNFDDLKNHPLEFIKSIYRFIGVNDDFVPLVLNKKVNPGRIPRSQRLESLFIKGGQFLRKHWTGLWWFLKKTGISESLLKANTEPKVNLQLTEDERKMLADVFRRDLEELKKII